MSKWVYFNVPAASPEHGCFLMNKFYLVDDEWAKEIVKPDPVTGLKPARYASEDEIAQQRKKKRLTPPEYDTEQNTAETGNTFGEDEELSPPPKGALK